MMKRYANKVLHNVRLLISVLLISWLILPANASQDGLYPERNIPETAGDKCVLPPAEIRRVHPDLLKHDRISTTRQGVRMDSEGKNLKGSIKACINCHAIKENNAYVRIDDPKHFCTTCHIYAGVSFDCFQCHRDVPEN